MFRKEKIKRKNKLIKKIMIIILLTCKWINKKIIIKKLK
jgi:hypothetical protein